jgi:hypothetical protein
MRAIANSRSSSLMRGCSVVRFAGPLGFSGPTFACRIHQ